MKKLLFVVFVFFLSENVFSQQFEFVEKWANTNPLVKTNDAFLIEKDRFYLMCGNFVGIMDDEFNDIGTIFKTNSTPMFYSADVQYGLRFYNDSSPLNYAPYIEITQILFNNDDNYETLYVTADALYINRCEYGIAGEFGTKIIVEGATIQTILPPDGTKFTTNIPPYVYSTKSGDFLGIITSDYHRVFYKINKGETTPIRQGVKISAISSDKKYYDVSGKRLDKPTKGINIVKYGNGTTKKVTYK